MKADPPRGVHLNLRVRGLGHSPTVAIDELSNRLRAEGREIYKLGLGQSPFPVPPVVVDCLRENAGRKEYLPVCGLPALREAVADYHRRNHGTRCRAEDVLIGPGSKELMFLLQVVFYGDLIVPTPSWVSYAPQARIVGRHVRWLHTSEAAGWRLQPEQLEALCVEDPGRPRIIVLNYPGNPTGGTYTPAELEALADVARAHEVVVLSDEIYGELHHRGEHVSIERFYSDGTIVSSGLSKWCGAGGWRLGTFAFPGALRWLLDAMAAVASETFTSTSAAGSWKPSVGRWWRGCARRGCRSRPRPAASTCSRASPRWRRAWRSGASTPAKSCAGSCSIRRGWPPCRAAPSGARRRS
jgi:aspartate aminotransferase